MPHDGFTRWLLLPELEWEEKGTGHAPSGDRNTLSCVKRSDLEVCPRCATPSTSTYDHRRIRVKDAPIHGKLIVLEIRKRRFWCRTCRKPFTEPVPGIAPRRRTTERYRAEILWAAERFSDLKAVRGPISARIGFCTTSSTNAWSWRFENARIPGRPRSESMNTASRSERPGIFPLSRSWPITTGNES